MITLRDDATNNDQTSPHFHSRQTEAQAELNSSTPSWDLGHLWTMLDAWHGLLGEEADCKGMSVIMFD